MKIAPATSQPRLVQGAPSSTAASSNAAAFSAALSTATAESDAPGTKQADFTSMTRQEMQDWSNEQIRSGNMSLDEGFSFMAMTMKIPVSGDVQAADDGERVDFTQKARAGIEGALSRNDDATRKMLESAIKIMQQYQGETIGVDTRA